jgi:hypothetical protein
MFVFKPPVSVFTFGVMSTICAQTNNYINMNILVKEISVLENLFLYQNFYCIRYVSAE